MTPVLTRGQARGWRRCGKRCRRACCPDCCCCCRTRDSRRESEETPSSSFDDPNRSKKPLKASCCNFSPQTWKNARHTGQTGEKGLDLLQWPLPGGEFMLFFGICMGFSFLSGMQDVQSLLQSGVWTASLTGNLVQLGLDLANFAEFNRYDHKHEWW